MNKRDFGFTLVELLLVIMVISILMAIATPIVFKAREKASKIQARKDVNAIEAAILAYYQFYGKLPMPSGSQNMPEPEYFTGAQGHTNDSKKIIYALTGRSNGVVSNPKKETFLTVRDTDKPGQVWKGKFEDPWDAQYEIKLDADYNGKVDFYSGGQEIVDSMVVVVSRGPDGVMTPPSQLAPKDEIMSYIIPK